MPGKKPLVICLTPVKNEASNIAKFLKCAVLWADHIILSDHNSLDDTVRIARSFPKVSVVKNDFNGYNYNEWHVRNILFNEAKKLPGRKIFLSVDADEILTPDFIVGNDWDKILNAEPGTVIKSKFVNITPDFKYYWLGPFDLPWGFIDDGSEYTADKIHTNRNIYPGQAPVVFLENIKLMHLQYTDWGRMESKHRWYQCWERINNPKKSAIEIYRSYHHMYSISKEELFAIPERWITFYRDKGINITEIKKEDTYYWDDIIIKYFDKYGAAFFRKESIWDINWIAVAKKIGYPDYEEYSDPRGVLQKLIHKWLKKTQKNYIRLDVRIISKIIKLLFKQ